MEFLFYLFLGWLLQFVEFFVVMIDNIFQYLAIFILFLIIYPIYNIFISIKKFFLEVEYQNIKTENKYKKINTPPITNRYLRNYILSELITTPCLIISAYLYYQSIPEQTGNSLLRGCAISIWDMIKDWFYQGITFSNYNSCTKPTLISKYYSLFFWLFLIGESIGCYYFFVKYKPSLKKNKLKN